MAREDPQMKLRMTPDLKARVEKAAVDAGRSVNAEIVQRLEASFTGPPLAAGERVVLDLLETLARIDPQMMRGVLAEVEMRVRDTRKPRQ